VLVVTEDGALHKFYASYTVDRLAPLLSVFAPAGPVAPGAEIEIEAEQIVRDSEILMVPEALRRTAADRKHLASVLCDAKTVHIVAPDGAATAMRRGADGRWRAKVRVPLGAASAIELRVVALDTALNRVEHVVRVAVARPVAAGAAALAEGL